MTQTTSYGLTYTVEMALSAATGTYGLWDVGLWDTATWGPDVVWADVSTKVVSIATSRKISRDFQGWDAGRATIVLDNTDGRFSPSNLAGLYAVGGITQIRPWRPVRVRCTWAGITYAVYYGYGLTWSDGWLGPSPGAGYATMTVACDDEFASLGRIDGLEQPAAGGGETSGKRIHRVLDAAGHTGLRNVDDGRMTMQPTTLASSVLSELKLTADSEGGAIYVGRDGAVVFEDVYSLIERTRSNTIQATFGDGGGAELAYNDIGAEFNGDLLSNIAAFSRVGGAVQQSADDTSRALYLDKRTSRTDLVCETDTQVKTLADLWLQRFKDPEYRITQVRVLPRYAPTTLFPAVLGREVRDLVRVVKRPPGGYTITQDVFVSGIDFEITDDNFVAVLTLSSGRPYTAFTTSRFDTGKWDSATWFY